MSRQFVIIANDAIRIKALEWLKVAPIGTRVTLQDPQRTLDQNALFWSMLTDLASQRPHHGIELSADDYKLLVLAALKREIRLAPNLDGDGFVNLGTSSSDLSKEEMSDCIEIMFALGARDGVVWTLDGNNPLPSPPIEEAPEAVPHDIRDWAVAFNQALANWTDANALKKHWADSMDKRQALFKESPPLADTLKRAVNARIVELRS